jgi:predicted DCC family thiol-disulfide oxidoreductase YuxK
MDLPCDHLVLFDGVCNLCSGAVKFIIRRDPAAVFKFAAIQSPLGQRLYRAHDLDPAHPDSMVLLTHDGAWRKSDAAWRIAKKFTGVWRLLAWIKFFPKPLRDWGYDFVARRRYRWFGQSDICLVPTPELRARFLEE